MNTTISRFNGVKTELLPDADKTPGSRERLKIVFLNAWSGRLEEPFSAFLKQQAVDTDVFCFQEADGKVAELCQVALKGFQTISAYKRIGETEDEFPQATYVRPDLQILASRLLLSDQVDTGLGIDVEVPLGQGTARICNWHGVSRPVHKLDNPTRLKQSAELIRSYEDVEGPVIIGGDFNVFPDTESIRTFSDNGYEDLIRRYNITNTRNRYAWERFPDTPQYYSDYVFARGGLLVRQFTVPDTLISDHLPMILEVEERGD